MKEFPASRITNSRQSNVWTAPYPAQFVLGPDFADRLSGWRFQVVNGALGLSLHPDLACARVTEGTQELTLVGHMLDPLAPAATNEEILGQLLRRFSSRTALIEATRGYGGRWLLVAAHGREKFLFNDALGLRQVFYTDPQETGALWAMSQPGIAADMLGLPVDPQAMAFVDSQAFCSDPESRWPGVATPFHGLHHLLPNHWLDLETGKSQRYWPAAPLPRVTPESAIERLAVLLPGMIRAAAARFDLALSLTAGLDSRLLLAAARDVKDRLSFVTVRQGAMPDDHRDVTVAGRLLDRLGLPHVVIRAAASMTPEFSRAFKRAVYRAHDLYGPDVEAILRRFSRTKIALTGSGAEVGRCSFRKELPWSDRRTIKAAHLARLQRMERAPFALHHFERWLDDAGSPQNIKLLDLFEWEQGHGNWLAMTQLEFDIAWREIITPYNCREVLTTLLGVDERHRRAPDYIFFRRLIEKLWPEVLQEPINPRPRQSLQGWVKGAIRSLPRYWS